MTVESGHLWVGRDWHLARSVSIKQSAERASRPSSSGEGRQAAQRPRGRGCTGTRGSRQPPEPTLRQRARKLLPRGAPTSTREDW